MTRLDEIRARLEKATPGPWKVSGDAVYGPPGSLYGKYQVWIADYGEAGDAALIANAPDDLRLLLDVAEAAAAFVAQYEMEKTWHGDAEFPADEYKLLAAAVADLNGPAS